jgi:sporulation protein YlmC with PRC-barrel domain
MRLSDLLGAQAFDSDGQPLGAVRDVRLVQDGPIQGTFGAGFRVRGLVVGGSAVSSRLGYDRRGVRGPWVIAALARRLSRDNLYVPWDDVAGIDDRRVEVARPAHELHAPIPLPDLRGPAS